MNPSPLARYKEPRPTVEALSPRRGLARRLPRLRSDVRFELANSGLARCMYSSVAAALLTFVLACHSDPQPTKGNMTASAHEQVEACLRTIDQDPDPGHNERTPSVACLIGLGRPALVPTIPLLSAASSSTRARAARVIDQITRRLFGFDGREWSDADRDRWMAWWSQIGYDYSAPADQRAAAIARLQQALAVL
jgi:hypothetical protein